MMVGKGISPPNLKRRSGKASLTQLPSDAGRKTDLEAKAISLRLETEPRAMKRVAGAESFKLYQ